MIINAIMDKIQTFLVADMYTAISSTDVTRLYSASSVFIGRNLLDDPEEGCPLVEIHPAFPGSDFPSEPLRSFKDPASESGVLTIAGPGTDMRFYHRFWVKGIQYFTTKDYARSQCRTYAGTFRNRLRKSILDNNVLGLEVENERDIGGANKGCIKRYVCRERGGPETDWIWEIYLLLEYQTEFVST